MGDRAGVQDGHLVAEVLDLGRVVAAQEHRRPAAGEAAQQSAQIPRAGRVEAVGRLVEDQQLGTAEQRGRRPQALPHPEGYRRIFCAAQGVRDTTSRTSSTCPGSRSPSNRASNSGFRRPDR
jgi:hypothetical protein